jgi:hypothetical protein
MVRSRIEYLRDNATDVDHERFEKIDCVTVIVTQLAYFEAWLISQATNDVDAFLVLRLFASRRVT